MGEEAPAAEEKKAEAPAAAENSVRRAKTWPHWKKTTRRLVLRQQRVKVRGRAMVMSSDAFAAETYCWKSLACLQSDAKLFSLWQEEIGIPHEHRNRAILLCVL